MKAFALSFVASAILASVSLGQAAPPAPPAPDSATPGELRSYATPHSIGVEWDISGDANHNAVCAVQFRKRGAPDWRQAMPLFRADYAWYYVKAEAKERANLFAGSILFLTPGTDYEVRLEMSDPDGGKAVKDLALRTRPIPRLAKDARVFHVAPGNGGGAGAEKDPFRGLAAAQEAAKPGDVFLLASGQYGTFVIDKAGEPGKYVAWKAAPGADVRFDRINVASPHVYFEGLRLDAGKDDPGLRDVAGVQDVVVSRCQFHGFNYSITLHRKSQDWHISDNIIVGDKPVLGSGQKVEKALSGEGVEMAESVGGHVVCYNRISRVADGFSYPGRGCDMYGNDITDASDDATELDRGWANNRVWGNRMANFGNSALSFQPMCLGPWYFLRNQIIGGQHEDTEVRKPHIFKFRVQDRFVFVNNTVVFAAAIDSYCDSFFTSLTRNNLFISSTGAKPIWVSFRYKEDPSKGRYVTPIQKPGWMTDVDYNGYDWGEDTNNWKIPVFRYHWTDEVRKCYMLDLKEFTEATGVEKHGLRVRKEVIFEEWKIPSGVARTPDALLTLKKDGPAVDAGSPLPNLAETFTGKAPDLGAFETGKPPIHFGPREPGAEDKPQEWSLY